MRVLKFIVNGQKLQKDSKCDFSGLVSGSSKWLQAEFVFSPEWDVRQKAASFFSQFQEYPVMLDENNKCMIPDEAVASGPFYVSVTGKEGDSMIPTNMYTVYQERRKC